MSYQKCPVCNGLAVIDSYYGPQDCPTCKGERIIDEVTGLPPSLNVIEQKKKESSFDERLLATVLSQPLV